MSNVNMSVRIGDLLLRNPVAAGSGTFGYALEMEEYVDLNRLGILNIKGTTTQPRKGNPPPRIAEVPSGIVASMGLENPGVDYVLNSIVPKLTKYAPPISINISGNSLEEYIELTEKVDACDAVSAIEINISCPNIGNGGAAFGADPIVAARVVKEVRARTKKTLITKMTPAVTDIVQVAKAVRDSGTDALLVANGYPAMAIDIKTRKPSLGNIRGGLSGPALKPINLLNVWRVAQEVDLPIIGCGGIFRAEDAIEYFLAGATAVSVATANLVDPRSTMLVIDGIEKYLAENCFSGIHEIIGLAWKQ